MLNITSIFAKNPFSLFMLQIFLIWITFGLFILSRFMCVCDYRRGMEWWMDLLTAYTHHSQLQLITAPPLISKH
jgi:hypothetical protein